MNLYGPHIHRSGMGLDLLGRGRFAAALAMDVDSEYIRKARERSPGTTLVIRVYEDGANFLDWTPEAWVGRLLARFPADKPEYFVTINEPFGHDSSELFERFDIWESEVIWLLQANGTDGLACNFGTGNFTSAPDRVKIPDVFPRICGIANAMGPHDYSWPTLEAGWSWYAGRWFKWYDDIKEAIGREMKFLIGECGLTQAIIAGRPDHGWQSGGPEGVTAESYLATLHWYLEQVVTWDAGREIVLGLCLFNWFDQYHWSFDHINRPEVVDAIIAMDVPVPEPPEPPNGGEPVQVRIFDRDDVERDEVWMRKTYGVTWRRHGTAPGQQVYRLVELREKTGNSSLVTKVVDENGKPMANIDVAFYWSKAPDPPEPPTTVSSYDWYRNFVHGPTNANGDVGPGMGTGAYHGPGECGPHKVWVRDPSTPSDICECLGMVAGTFHDHMDQKFKLTDAEVEPPEPPVGDDLLAAALRLDANVAKMLKIMEEGYVPPDEPPPDPEPEIFHVEFFNNEELAGEPVYTTTEAPPFWHDWGSGSPAPGVNADHVSGRWSGSFTFAAGVHTFNVKTDDGARLWIDDKLVLDKWYPQSATLHSVNVTLTAGLHKVVLEWFEAGGHATLHFNWV